jgi:hypothetical protein
LQFVTAAMAFVLLDGSAKSPIPALRFIVVG